MAKSNRVFVSPGVYTSEKDLTFVSQSVGVTTLGLVGDTLKGPAFEPILITNFDEFKTYFGTTSPLKDGSGNPKYELPYAAKSYLQESNQLFVTKILGLTGYKPVKTFGIKTLGGVTLAATVPTETAGTLTGTTGLGTFNDPLTGKTATTGVSIPNFIVANQSTYVDDDWFTIGLVPETATSGLTGTQLTGEAAPIGDFTGYTWSNEFFNGSTEVYSYLMEYDSATDIFAVTQFTYTASVNNYDNILVSALRSRGRYVSDTLVLETTGLTMTSAIDAISGESTIESNPLGDFTLTAGLTGGGTKVFTCSLDSTSTKYVNKVLGTEVNDKSYSDYPFYSFEEYSNLVAALNSRGLIRGLSVTALEHTVGNDFLSIWDTPASPMVVSEVRGGRVADLFQVISIPDGDSANRQTKITILNVDLDTAEFDMVVRDFNDSDDNMVVLEKYSRCTMNPELPGYIALKVGTSDTTYELKSKYIMLNMVDDHPTDAIPAGFKGFTADTVGLASLGNLQYKTSYYTAGDVVTYTNGVADNIATDKVKRVSLGLSTQMGYDNDLFKYKGVAADYASTGFHLSTNASTITGGTITGFMYDTTPYDLEGTDKGLLATVPYRKFTFAVCGGYDGWDIYRTTKTYGDGYIYGKTTYSDADTDNGGVFDPDSGNSDYYAYLAGIETFANPEAVDINVFATPGINWYDQSSLVDAAIDMTENDRADSLYIIGAPNYSTADEVIDAMDTIGLDSNYSATFWPWIQVRDNDNSTQLFIPPTGEVLRNIALTDNVAYPWFATAGYSRGLVNAVKALKKLTLDERDNLYKMRINPMATFSDTGP